MFTWTQRRKHTHTHNQRWIPPERILKLQPPRESVLVGNIKFICHYEMHKKKIWRSHAWKTTGGHPLGFEGVIKGSFEGKKILLFVVGILFSNVCFFFLSPQVSTEAAAVRQSEPQTFSIGVLPQIPGFPQLDPDCDLQVTVRPNITKCHSRDCAPKVCLTYWLDIL